MATAKRYGLTGISTNVELGKGGSRIELNGTAIEFKNAADNAFVKVRGDHPIGDNDFVTLKYLLTKADVTVSGQIDGGAPPSVVVGAVYIVTTAGGGYGLKELYYGITGSWEQITVPADLKIATTVALTGGTDTYLGDTIYVWDADTSTWVKVGPAPESTNGFVKSERVTIAYGDTSPVNIGSPVTLNGVVRHVMVNVTQAFDTTSESTLSIGASGAVARHMATSEIDLMHVGRYAADDYYLYGSATQLIATLTLGTGTPGAGQCDILVEYAKAP